MSADLATPGTGALSEVLQSSWPSSREPRTMRPGPRLLAWMTGGGLIVLLGLSAAASRLGAGPLPLGGVGVLLAVYSALAWVTAGFTAATLRQRVVLGVVQSAVAVATLAVAVTVAVVTAIVATGLLLLAVVGRRTR